MLLMIESFSLCSEVQKKRNRNREIANIYREEEEGSWVMGVERFMRQRLEKDESLIGNGAHLPPKEMQRERERERVCSSEEWE